MRPLDLQGSVQLTRISTFFERAQRAQLFVRSDVSGVGMRRLNGLRVDNALMASIKKYDQNY
jgi:hypothetical protein